MGFLSSLLGSGRPLEKIGEASHRKVYLVRDGSEARKRIFSESGEEADIQLEGRALKVALDEDGVKRNLREYKTFMELKDSELGTDLNPAFYCTEDGEFLVSRLVETDVSVGGEVNEFYNRVKKEALEIGIDPQRLDVGINNVGFDNKRGKYVIYDYPWIGE